MPLDNLTPDGRKGRKNPGSHFAKLSQTPEGRAQLAEWRARRKPDNFKAVFGRKPGWTRYMRNKALAHAKGEAQQLMTLMEAKGIELPQDAQAREALEVGITVMRLTDISPKDRLAAASLVLQYTKAKPASETNLNVKKAEDFLADLAAEL